ncbi:MAG: hypothetical protein Q7T30_02035 [Planctomycetota bacterium]|nr:hypothetical protein [Planctomycetota bacterium]
MNLFVTFAHLAAFVMLGLALPLPKLRRQAMVVLAGAAALGFVHAGLGPAERELTTIHNFAGYEGSSQEVTVVYFPTGTQKAPGWQWPVPFLGFAMLWIAVLRALGERLPRSPWLLPMLFAWSATAAWLGMQYLAAPAATVQPVGLDRFLFPAGLALALLAAKSSKSLVSLLFLVSLTTVGARLPAALFSKAASDLQLGSCLDVSTVRDIVNPMTQMQFEPRLVLGSAQQQFWLIWLEHLIIFPALYLMSLFGIAFGAYLIHKHGPETEGLAVATRA